MKFYKMHGLGNDFIIVQDPQQEVSRDLIRQLCHRKTGIGCDQFFILRGCNIEIYNSDGSEASSCINGVRCVAFLRHLQTGDRSIQLRTKERELTCRVVETMDSEPYHGHNKSGHLLGREGLVSVEVGGYKLQDFEYRGRSGLLVDVGNKHVIFPIDDISLADMTLAAELNHTGRPKDPDGATYPSGHYISHILGKDATFPDGVNVSFAHVTSEHEVYLKVYERGVGETMACGSAACAAYAGLYDRGFLSKNNDVSVIFEIGRLSLSMLEEESIILKGGASMVFEGVVQLV